MPPEWAPHEACLLAWPYQTLEWYDIHGARRELVALARAIADPDPCSGRRHGEKLYVLVPGGRLDSEARKSLANLVTEFLYVPYRDVWLRDTTPVFLLDVEGQLGAACFHFNGWGGRFASLDDRRTGGALAKLFSSRRFDFPWVLEGGAVDVDGAGTALVGTRCVVNRNRNPSITSAELDAGIREAIGVDKILWLDGCLANDHTDGHVDTLARFIDVGVVACSEATDRDDPNREVYQTVANALRGVRGASGRRIELVRVPSPGRVVDLRGRVAPASYLNFYIANTTIAVPVYGSRNDHTALDVIAGWFPERRVVGVPVDSLITEGGALHCVTRQLPAAFSSTGEGEV